MPNERVGLKPTPFYTLAYAIEFLLYDFETWMLTLYEIASREIAREFSLNKRDNKKM